MKNEIDRRIGQFQEKLTLRRLDGALLVQKVDLYYLSGTDQDAQVWVPASGDPLLMVRKSLERAKEDSPLSHIVRLQGFSSLPDLISNHGGRPQRIGLELDILPTAFYKAYETFFKGMELVDISPIIRSLRMIKSPYELSCISRAAEMADGVYRDVPAMLKEARTELALAASLERAYRIKGHPGFVRTRGFNRECLYGQVMAGPSGAVPSNSPGPTGGRGLGPFYSQSAAQVEIRPHEPILVDYAANVEGYISDQTRIYALGGLPEDLYRAHQVMRDIQDALAGMGRPGVSTVELYHVAMEMVKEAHLEQGFMGYPDAVPFVGHGVGLDIDEWPIVGRNNPTLLEEGMVMALEPKCVFPGQGAVGVENTFVVTPTGMKRLNRLPDDIILCE